MSFSLVFQNKQTIKDILTKSFIMHIMLLTKERYLIDTCHLFPKDALLLALNDRTITFLGYTDVTLEEKMNNLRL